MIDEKKMYTRNEMNWSNASELHWKLQNLWSIVNKWFKGLKI